MLWPRLACRLCTALLAVCRAPLFLSNPCKFSLLVWASQWHCCHVYQIPFCLKHLMPVDSLAKWSMFVELRLVNVLNPFLSWSCLSNNLTFSGNGWSFLDPVCTAELRDRTAEGEFWLDEAEFTSQFDDITVGYPIGKDGLLKSVYTGYSSIIFRN